MNILLTRMSHIIPALVLFSALFFSLPASAIKSVSVYALFNDSAILVIDGRKRMMKAGETSQEGLTLVSSTTGNAVIRINGKEEIIGLDINPAKEAMHIGSENITPIGDIVTLSMDSSGFFHADGEINGQSVTFLVDTGANAIAMNASTARSLDIDYESGRRAVASTANGNVAMYRVALDKVRIGSIEIDNVLASVIQDPGPAEILLGMSFLSHVEMKRSGSTMELIKR